MLAEGVGDDLHRLGVLTVQSVAGLPEQFVGKIGKLLLHGFQLLLKLFLPQLKLFFVLFLAQAHFCFVLLFEQFNLLFILLLVGIELCCRSFQLELALHELRFHGTPLAGKKQHGCNRTCNCTNH